MVLDLTVNSSALDIVSTGNTIIEPGNNLEVKIKLTAKAPLTIASLDWALPSVFKVTGVEGGFHLPLQLGAGQSAEKTYILGAKKSKEGFGTVKAQIKLTRDGVGDEEIEWEFWSSVFSRKELISETELPDDCRKRLVEVVNEYAQNGHIFLADPVQFFKEYLNVEMVPELQKELIYFMELDQEGLPISQEEFKAFACGKKKFFGIEKLDLFPEEEPIEYLGENRYKETDYRIEL